MACFNKISSSPFGREEQIPAESRTFDERVSAANGTKVVPDGDLSKYGHKIDDIVRSGLKMQEQLQTRTKVHEEREKRRVENPDLETTLASTKWLFAPTCKSKKEIRNYEKWVHGTKVDPGAKKDNPFHSVNPFDVLSEDCADVDVAASQEERMDLGPNSVEKRPEKFDIKSDNESQSNSVWNNDGTFKRKDLPIDYQIVLAQREHFRGRLNQKLDEIYSGYIKELEEN